MSMVCWQRCCLSTWSLQKQPRPPGPWRESAVPRWVSEESPSGEVPQGKCLWSVAWSAPALNVDWLGIVANVQTKWCGCCRLQGHSLYHWQGCPGQRNPSWSCLQENSASTKPAESTLAAAASSSCGSTNRWQQSMTKFKKLLWSNCLQRCQSQ